MFWVLEKAYLDLMSSGVTPIDFSPFIIKGQPIRPLEIFGDDDSPT